MIVFIKKSVKNKTDLKNHRGGYGVAHTLLSLRDISPGRGITSAARDINLRVSYIFTDSVSVSLPRWGRGTVAVDEGNPISQRRTG